MLKSLKRYWSSLKRGHPGSRFQEQYDRQQEKHASRAGRVLRILAGGILIPAGLFFLPAPGPGFLVLGLGAVLIAREFKSAARALDWLEVRARRMYNTVRRAWRKLVTARRQGAR